MLSPGLCVYTSVHRHTNDERKSGRGVTSYLSKESFFFFFFCLALPCSRTPPTSPTPELYHSAKLAFEIEPCLGWSRTLASASREPELQTFIIVSPLRKRCFKMRELSSASSRLSWAIKQAPKLGEWLRGTSCLACQVDDKPQKPCSDASSRHLT